MHDDALAGDHVLAEPIHRSLVTRLLLLPEEHFVFPCTFRDALRKANRSGLVERSQELFGRDDRATDSARQAEQVLVNRDKKIRVPYDCELQEGHV